MRWFSMMSLVLLIGLSVPAVARDLSDPEYAHMLDLILEARPDAAAALLDSLEAECAGEPVFLLARGRLLLEDIPMDDADKEETKVLSEAMLDLMEQCIAVCDARLDAGQGDRQTLTLQRGWAWMMRSQAHAIGHNFWSAGREAGKGKRDLDNYLEDFPGDPVASGLLGAFLYFTDAVPEVIQVLSKLAMMPTGDRELGLSMIQTARSVDNPLRNDWRMLDVNVSLYFEGRLEEGLPRAEALHDSFPAYARLALAPALGRIWVPAREAEYAARIDRTVALAKDLAVGGKVKSSLWTARFFRAWGDRFLVGAGASREAFEAIVTAAPERPDWVVPMARLKLVELAAEGGDRPTADRLAAEILADEALKMVHKPAANLRKQLKDAAPTGHVADWYQAEASLLTGDFTGAESAFRKISSAPGPMWLQDYRLLSTVRVAELKALRGEYRSASRWLKKSLKYFSGAFRLDWVIKGRSRYFDELDAQGAPPPAQEALFSRP